MIAQDILGYNDARDAADRPVCELLATVISRSLPQAEQKVWHGHPVWFLDGNPIVGYSKEKKGIRLMFWSGADFEEPALAVRGEKFRDASIFYHDTEAVNMAELERWLEKSVNIQWDYKNLVKRKGRLERLQ